MIMIDDCIEKYNTNQVYRTHIICELHVYIRLTKVGRLHYHHTTSPTRYPSCWANHSNTCSIPSPLISCKSHATFNSSAIHTT